MCSQAASSHTKKFKMGETELDKKRREALQLLHPVCKSLMTDMKKENVMKLTQAVDQIDGSVLQDIQQYILFPVQSGLHLKQRSESLLQALCEAVVAILKRTQISLPEVFFDIFNPLMYSIVSCDEDSKASRLSEETKTAVIRAVTCLLQSSEKVLPRFYSLSSLPMVSQLITVLLSLSLTEKSRSLQILALDCMLELLQTNTKYGKVNEVQLGNLFAFCLPGITTFACRIITGDTKKGQAVLVKALQVWCRTVVLVMSDSLLLKAQEELGKSSTLDSKDKLPQFLESLNGRRDEAWVKATASKLQILTKQICKLVSHRSWQVRLTLAETADRVLSACSRSLSESLPVLLEALVGLMCDDYGNVAKKAQTALKSFAACQSETTGQRSLVQILEENLYNLCTSLPRQLKLCDEEEKPAVIKVLNGYLSILGPQINCVIESAPHLQRLCLALLQALEMDYSNISILEEGTSGLNLESEVGFDVGSLHVWRPKKYFRHFREDNILNELMLACRQLGKFGNVDLLVDYLLDLFHESRVYQLASVLVINEVIVGAGSRLAGKIGDHCDDSEKKIMDSVVRTLLDEYLASENIKAIDRLLLESRSSHELTFSSLVVAKPGESPGSHRDILRIKHSILLVSLFMEGIAKMSTIMKEDFQVHLIQVLYPLVENLGHENVHISTSAYATLVEVSLACGHTSLDSLIRSNSDYLIGSLSLKLRHFRENPRAAQTLCVILRYGTSDMLPHATHSITQCLDSLDENYLEELVHFMPVLLELARAIGRWFPASRQNQLENNKGQVTNLGPVILDPHKCASDFVDRIKARQVEQELLIDENVDDKPEKSVEEVEEEWQQLLNEQSSREEAEKQEEEAEEEKKPEVPFHVQILLEVLKRVRNLLATKDGRLTVQALDVVCQAVQVLADHEKELLPQIYELWKGFHPLFHSPELFIVIKALKTLLVITEVSGDFLKQQVKKVVIPTLAAFMEKQAKISHQMGSPYTFTNSFKLQLCVLSVVGPLSRHLQLDSNSLDQVAKMCLPYLNNSQPELLQKAAKEAFSEFIRMDPDAMWLLLTTAALPASSILLLETFPPFKN